jgi:hypothetical protein
MNRTSWIQDLVASEVFLDRAKQFRGFEVEIDVTPPVGVGF